MRAIFKRVDSRGHFRDFWHRASSRRNDKRIGARRERRALNGTIDCVGSVDSILHRGGGGD